MRTLLITLMFTLFSINVYAANDLELPTMSSQSLDNGMQLQLMERHDVPLIDLVLLVKTGAVHDNKSGLAWLTGNSLLLGTQTLTKNALEEKLDSLGASVEIEVGAEGTEIHSRFLAKDQSVMFALLRDIIAQPRLAKQDVTDLRQLHLATLQQMRESPRIIIKPYFKRFVWGNNPFANPIQGTQKDVAEITLKDVKHFYDTWYSPDNVVLSIAGDINTAQATQSLRTIFAPWHTGHAAPRVKLAAPITPDKARVLLVDKSDATETTIMIGGRGIDSHNPDWARIDVLNTVLGGRFTSWLNQALRVEKGYTYGAKSRFMNGSAGGLFYITTFTRNATSEPAIDLALATYHKLFTGALDATTLASAKAYITGQFPPTLSTNGALASAMSHTALYHQDMARYQQFGSQVQGLTLNDSNALIASSFPKDALQVVLIGNADELRKFASKYGEIQEVSIKAKDYSLGGD